jgi:Tfp pilus assembly protein PilF
MPDSRRELAQELFEKAYGLQLQGEMELAIHLYRRSIEMCPTAEAHTYLGWSYRSQGDLEAAIAECKKAISLDPDFGNPYNDIGAYLIELDRAEEALPWLEQAVRSVRYDAYHYPWYNLGRVYAAKEMYNKARECFQQSLEFEPGYELSVEALQKLRMLLQ